MIPVIISGGSGTRLWPKSRATFPKQFVQLLDESLQVKTIRRLKKLGEPWVLTVSELETLTQNTLREENVPLVNAIYEPFGQNTGPALALLCKVFLDQEKENKIVGIFPADHLIENEAEFFKAVQLGEEFAQKDQVVTLGIKPTYPATGYGYIETDLEQYRTSSTSKLKVYKTLNFKEKPTLEKAQYYIQQGRFFWNAGMFIFKVKIMAEHIQRFMPETWLEISKLHQDFSNIKDIYKKLKNESIDFGVMEKLEEQVCVPCEIGWSDLGSWDEIAHYKKTSSHVLEINGHNNFVEEIPEKIYGFVDVDDLVVVDSQDALLVSKKGKTQNVKLLIDKLKAENPKVLKAHPFEHRPWGYFEVIKDTSDFKSKIMKVNPGQQISYQSHKKRAEHWVIIKGNPEVILDGKVHRLKPGDYIFIPLESKHRIKNPTLEVIEFVEVQTGTYFGEDDIVRYEDDYGRKP